MNEEHVMFSRYPLDIETLPGFEPTELELQVIGNPTFQKLRREGLRDMVFLASGLKYHGYLPLTEDLKLSLAPSRMAEICYEHYADRAAMDILLCKIRRENKGLFEQEPDLDDIGVLRLELHWERERGSEVPDHRLLYDFTRWLSRSEEFEGFRWERQDYELLSLAHEQEMQEQLAKFRQSGDSQLVLVLTNNLPSAPRKRLLTELTARCATEKGLDLEEEGSTNFYMPKCQCMGCGTPVRHSLAGDCEVINAISIFDCGDLGEVKAWVSNEKLRHQLDFRQLNLPRSCFRGHRAEPMKPPNLAIFDLRAFDDKTRQAIYSKLQKCVEGHRANMQKQHPNEQTATELLSTGPKREVVVVADTRYFAHHADWASSIGQVEGDETYREREEKRDWFAEGLLVTTTH